MSDTLETLRAEAAGARETFAVEIRKRVHDILEIVRAPYDTGDALEKEFEALGDDLRNGADLDRLCRAHEALEREMCAHSCINPSDAECIRARAPAPVREER